MTELHLIPGGAHKCSLSNNPRTKAVGRCDCGRRVEPPPILPPLPPPQQYRARNVQFERDCIENAGRIAGVDPEPLLQFTQARAEAFPKYGAVGSVRVGPKWLYEARCELADCANYIVWWLETHLDHPRRPYAERALQTVLISYDALVKVEEL